MVIDTTRLVYLRGDVMEDCIFIGFLESLLVLVDLSSRWGSVLKIFEGFKAVGLS